MFECSGDPVNAIDAVWTLAAEIQSDDPNSNIGYAVAISLDGHRVAAGAPGYDGGAGAVAIIDRAQASGNWTLSTFLQTQRPSIPPTSPLYSTAKDLAGIDVAISGDGRTVVSGAPYHSEGSPKGDLITIGNVYVFDF